MSKQRLITMPVVCFVLVCIAFLVDHLPSDSKSKSEKGVVSAGEKTRDSSVAVARQEAPKKRIGFGVTTDEFVMLINKRLVAGMISNRMGNRGSSDYLHTDNLLPPYKASWGAKQNDFGKIVYLDPSTKLLDNLVEKVGFNETEMHKMKARAQKYLFPQLWVEKGASNPSAIVITLHDYEPAAWGIYGHFIGSVIGAIQEAHNGRDIASAKSKTEYIARKLFDLENKYDINTVHEDGVVYGFGLVPQKRGGTFMAWLSRNWGLSEKELTKRWAAQ